MPGSSEETKAPGADVEGAREGIAGEIFCAARFAGVPVSHTDAAFRYEQHRARALAVGIDVAPWSALSDGMRDMLAAGDPFRVSLDGTVRIFGESLVEVAGGAVRALVPPSLAPTAAAPFGPAPPWVPDPVAIEAAAKKLEAERHGVDAEPGVDLCRCRTCDAVVTELRIKNGHVYCGPCFGGVEAAEAADRRALFEHDRRQERGVDRANDAETSGTRAAVVGRETTDAYLARASLAMTLAQARTSDDFARWAVGRLSAKHGGADRLGEELYILIGALRDEIASLRQAKEEEGPALGPSLLSLIGEARSVLDKLDAVHVSSEGDRMVLRNVVDAVERAEEAHTHAIGSLVKLRGAGLDLVHAIDREDEDAEPEARERWRLALKSASRRIRGAQ